MVVGQFSDFFNVDFQAKVVHEVCLLKGKLFNTLNLWFLTFWCPRYSWYILFIYVWNREVEYIYCIKYIIDVKQKGDVIIQV